MIQVAEPEQRNRIKKRNRTDKGAVIKTFKLHLPGHRGFSVNKAYYKASFTRTVECRKWADSIAGELCSPSNLKTASEFKSLFMEDPQAIGVFMKFSIPRGIFYTKTGDISRFSMDLTNVEKLLLDIIFDKKFGPHALDLDDKLVVQCISEKVPADLFGIDVSLRILKRL